MNEMALPSRHRIRNSSPGDHEAEHAISQSPQYLIFTSERRSLHSTIFGHYTEYTEYGVSSSVLALSLKVSNAGPGP